MTDIALCRKPHRTLGWLALAKWTLVRSSFYPSLAASTLAITASARSIAVRSSSLCHESMEWPSSNDRSWASCARELSSRSAAIASASSLASAPFSEERIISFSLSRRNRGPSTEIVTVYDPLPLPSLTRQEFAEECDIDVLMAYGRCLRPALYSSLRSSPSHPTGVSALRVTITIANARKRSGLRKSTTKSRRLFRNGSATSRRIRAGAVGGSTAMGRTAFCSKSPRVPRVSWLGSWALGTSNRGVPPVIGTAVENLPRDHQTVRLRRER
jgi:hypothetical protein